MVPDDKMMCGIAGTVVGATGAGLSVTELQAIISIVITVSGFIISVLVPLIIKLVKKIKAAKEDGVITEEEKEDIKKEIKISSGEIIKEGKEVLEQIKEQKQKSKK